MTENKILMGEARKTLEGKWGLAVGGFFIYMFITAVAGSPDNIGPLLSFLIGGPMLIGISLFSLSLARSQQADISQLFEGFKDFIKAFLANLLVTVFIILWALLLIVPGIIAALSYSQTFFILSQDKTVSARDAIKKSKAMMMGHKKKLFYLFCRFIGWFLIGILTLGIGFLWILPYFYVTLAKFYEEVSKQVA